MDSPHSIIIMLFGFLMDSARSSAMSPGSERR